MLFFFLVMSDLCVVFPSREGFKGVCDGERCGIG